MSKFTFITTFAKRHDLGYVLAKSFNKYVDRDINLHIYGDLDMSSDFKEYNNVHFSILKRDHINNFINNGAKEKQANIGIISQRRSKDFLYDAIRFCFKAYCQIQHHKINNTRYMIWVDSDVEFIDDVGEEDLNELVRDDCYISYLHRKTRYTETGWIIFDTHHPHHNIFFSRFADLYNKHTLFKLKHWTDCHAFDHCRILAESEGIKNHSLTSSSLLKTHGDHAWQSSPLVKFSKHWKGPRDNHIKL